MRLPVFSAILGLSALPAVAQETLPETAPLDWEEEDYSERIMDGAHAFVENEIESAAAIRLPFPLDPETRSDHVTELRRGLREKLGVVDDRLEAKLETFSDDPLSFEGAPASSLVAEGPGFEVHQARWPVLGGYYAEGLYVNPVSDPQEPVVSPLMVLIPDAADTPEDLLGLTDRLPPAKQMALRFALTGFRILIPDTVDRSLYAGPDGENERIVKSNQSHREWLYRQAFQMGRHPLGYDIQAALAGVDIFEMRFPGAEVTLAGYGEGGRAALYGTAIDTRIDHAFVSGAFAPRDRAWSEPIDRNLFSLLPDYSDAVVAAMILPRPLLIEHTEFPEVEDRKGTLATPAEEEVQREVASVTGVLGALTSPPNLLTHTAKDGSRAEYPSVAGFLQAIGLNPDVDRTAPLALMLDRRLDFDPAARNRRIFDGIQEHVQSLVDSSEKRRRESFFFSLEPDLRPGSWSTEAKHPTLVPTNFIVGSAEHRRQFAEEIIGEFEEELLPLRPRSRQIAEADAWTAWDVVLDVYPGFEAWGVLVLPKGIEPGEKRPVVVCQHGRNGVPRDTLDAGKSAYNDFAAKLAERGFIAFAPHNLYRGEDRYRWLDRKANLIGGTLFSFIVASHEQNLAWLKTLPQADGDRIAFYGLSYGGESAMRIPAILTDYSLSICSGDFNSWTRKVADPDFPNGFMQSVEWEMPYWNLGNTFDYAEMAGLIFPRPFFVERGHHDHVSVDEWVAHEYARVRWLYAQFGLRDRTGIEFFQGGHSIHGAGSFDFLHRHLDWPR